MFRPAQHVLVSLSLGLGVATAAPQHTYYVSPCGNDAASGMTPDCGAFHPGLRPKQTIQAAINSSGDGAVVVVLPGAYNETIDFFGKAITVTSSDGPDVTIIHGRGAAPVVNFSNGEGPDSVIEGFTITGGSAVAGGGMSIYHASPAVRNCTFVGNSAVSGSAVIASGPATVTDCRFTANTAAGQNGGTVLITELEHEADVVRIVNCTIADNSGGGVVKYLEVGRAEITNCIIWQNNGASIAGATSDLAVTYTDIQGGAAGVGNLNVDPKFGAYYRLGSDSPCLDAGNTLYLPVPRTDLAGQPRVMDFPAAPDQGVSAYGVTIDMGAYERHPSTCCSVIGGAGCDCPSCQSCVCDLDAFCCNVAWDALCVAEAQNDCAGVCSCED